MNIVQTKTITPLSIYQSQEDEFSVFQDRENLHQGEIPSFFVYINEYAWETFLSHTKGVYKQTKHEGQGIFLGKYFKDNFGEFVVAIKYYEGEGESSHGYVGMSEECLSDISKKCVAENLLMLIWIHTHPTFGAFYSGTDTNCLKTNFFMPFQTGIVVDIIREDIKGFKVQAGRVEEFKYYSLYNDEKRHLFQPYETKKPKEVNTPAIDIKKKESTGMFHTSPENVSQELKGIQAELENIKNLITQLLTKANATSQTNFPVEEINSLKTDLAFIKEQIMKTELPETPPEVTPQLSNLPIEEPEIIKTEDASTKERLNDNEGQSLLNHTIEERLEKQNKMQLIVLILVLVLVLVGLIINVLLIISLK